MQRKAFEHSDSQEKEALEACELHQKYQCKEGPLHIILNCQLILCFTTAHSVAAMHMMGCVYFTFPDLAKLDYAQVSKRSFSQATFASMLWSLDYGELNYVAQNEYKGEKIEDISHDITDNSPPRRPHEQKARSSLLGRVVKAKGVHVQGRPSGKGREGEQFDKAWWVDIDHKWTLSYWDLFLSRIELHII